jgi:hypothetical protein
MHITFNEWKTKDSVILNWNDDGISHRKSHFHNRDTEDASDAAVINAICFP